jgi:quinol monooxygenase YgiN
MDDTGEVVLQGARAVEEGGEEESGCILCDFFRGGRSALETHMRAEHLCAVCDELASDLRAHCLVRLSSLVYLENGYTSS